MTPKVGTVISRDVDGPNVRMPVKSNNSHGFTDRNVRPERPMIEQPERPSEDQFREERIALPEISRNMPQIYNQIQSNRFSIINIIFFQTVL